MNLKNLIFTAFGMFIFSTYTSAQIEINQWRGPNRTGVYSEESNLLTEWPEKGPELVWDFNELGKGYASPVILQDKVIIPGTVDGITNIFAFDHRGKLLYKTELGSEWMQSYPGINSTPTIYYGLGYIQGGLGVLYCFNPDDGRIVWTKDLFKDFDGKNITWGITENLLADGDKLFCTPGGEEYNVVALNRHNGDLIWKCSGKGEISEYGSPILVDIEHRKYLVTTTESSVQIIDSETGELSWSDSLNSGHVYAPHYQDGKLLLMGVARPAGYLMLDLSNGINSIKKVWSTQYAGWRDGCGVVVGENIYGSNADGKKIYCMDWNTGSIKASVKIQSEDASLIVADGMIYSYGTNGEFSLLKHDGSNFQVVSTFDVIQVKRRTHFSHPVIHDGRLYVRYNNNLMVYNISK